MNHILLSTLLIFSSIILCNLIIYGIRKRNLAGILMFSALMMAMVIHSLGYALELMGTTQEGIYFWIKIEYLGVAFYPFLIFLFVREYVDEKRYANKVVLTLVLTISLVTLVLVWTNGYHGLYYSSMELTKGPGFPVLIRQWGIWYYVQLTSLYGSILYSILVFSVRLVRFKGVYRAKLIFGLLGVMVPLVSLIIYVFGIGPEYIDITPFSFLLMTILIVIGARRYDIFALTPVTYEMIFNSLNEAIIAVDTNHCLLSNNQASKEFFPSIVNLKVGESIEKIQELVEHDFSSIEGVHQVNDRVLSFRVNQTQKNKVRIFVISDITEQELVKKQLEILATYDMLTGLYNRRYFMDAMKEQQEQGVFVMIDLDYFKKINDTKGHFEGDKVLGFFGQTIKEFFGKNLSCRFGGEEFLIFIEDTTISDVRERVENLRQFIANTELPIRFTFSAGLAEYQGTNMGEALRVADENLYRAKEQGRNLTCG